MAKCSLCNDQKKVDVKIENSGTAPRKRPIVEERPCPNCCSHVYEKKNYIDDELPPKFDIGGEGG